MGAGKTGDGEGYTRFATRNPPFDMSSVFIRLPTVVHQSWRAGTLRCRLCFRQTWSHAAIEVSRCVQLLPPILATPMVGIWSPASALAVPAMAESTLWLALQRQQASKAVRRYERRLQRQQQMLKPRPPTLVKQQRKAMAAAAQQSQAEAQARATAASRARAYTAARAVARMAARHADGSTKSERKLKAEAGAGAAKDAKSKATKAARARAYAAAKAAAAFRARMKPESGA